jgi:hypothetical protein
MTVDKIMMMLSKPKGLRMMRKSSLTPLLLKS